MSKLPAIELGTFGPGPREGKPFKIDLELLMEQNLLIQANSGGGKSWALRRLIEQAYGKLPIIIIDPEGEFGSLRQKYDFLLVGKGGETPADMRSAKKLAHRLLEHRVSAVCDIYELGRARGDWVAAFLTALVAAPKELWTDVMIVVDEAHDYAPEKGHGSSPALEAMAATASKGRKRGQMLVAATQRIGKFAKDVAAELKNALVGLTWLDIDRDRAADALGISKANRPAFFEAIKIVNPGSFYGLGRALHLLDPAPLQMGRPETEHPKRGQRRTAPPPPTKAILHLLPQLGDLPKEVEQEAETEAALRAEVGRLRAELARADRAMGKPKAEVVVHQVPPALRRAVAGVGKVAERLGIELGLVSKRVREIEAAVEQAEKEAALPASRRAPAPAAPTNDASERRHDSRVPLKATAEAGVPDLGRAARALLTALAQLGGSAGDREISLVSGYSITSSSFANALSELRTAGLVEQGQGQPRVLTEPGRLATAVVPPLPGGQELCDWWRRRLGKCESALLVALYDAGGRLTREALSEKSGYSITSSSFANGLSTLRAGRLAETRGPDVELAPTFLDHP